MWKLLIFTLYEINSNCKFDININTKNSRIAKNFSAEHTLVCLYLNYFKNINFEFKGFTSKANKYLRFYNTFR